MKLFIPLLFISILLMLMLPAWSTVRIVKGVQADRAYLGYLKRAADANTIELAKQELGRAVSYLQEHNMTSGYTSVFYTTPDEDVGFWFNNLNQSLNELNKLSSTATELEKSNTLMKLRQTLLDHKESGEEITSPDGISVFPNNVLWASLFGFCILSFVAGLAGLIMLLRRY
jgi:hypothetical protein